MESEFADGGSRHGSVCPQGLGAGVMPQENQAREIPAFAGVPTPKE